jgi:hypothetical protein
MTLMRTSANYLQILAVIIAFIGGCNADIPQPVEEKKHIDKASKIVQERAEKGCDPELTKEPFYNPDYYGASSCYRQTTEEEATVKNYTFKVSQKDADKKVCIDIFRSGRKIRSDCSDSMNQLAIITRPDPGTDINGDGIPEVIAYEYTSEWHCCSIYAIFSLGKKLKLIDVLYGEHSYIFFRDLDGDGKHEAIGLDWTFAYWSSSFTGSPAPQVILRWKNGKYRLAEDLMKKPPPGEKELYTMPSGFEKGQTYTLLSSMMLDLIYTGNGNLALQYCDWFWQNLDNGTSKQKRLKEKKDFLAAFKKQLRKSHYWGDLKKMNGW